MAVWYNRFLLSEKFVPKYSGLSKGKRLKIFYATQVATKPPTFVILVNEEELMHFSYLRFLENQIRKAFVFEGTPIHLIARKRK
ncbi:hypothetical protein [Streptococcus gordonii]|uniref:hypothetical protein n=1 Tax=Streptococcus gordonii TaxID=1302 RepID=UPI003FA353EC